MLLGAGVVVVVVGVLWVTAPWPVVGGVGGGVDSAMGVGGAGVADGEGVIGDTWWLACLVVF